VSESTGLRAPSAGDLIAGRYRLDALAGQGGMAQVWQAWDIVLDRRVAVKLLHPHLRTDPATLERFRNEGIVAARVTHPGIVAVYDTTSGADGEAIVMEFVDGRTLRSHLDERSRRLSPAEVVSLGCSLADALEVAHQVGLIHRDIKPANILLCDDGGVKLADFGIAKMHLSRDLTRDGTLVGTATYLAPEQLRGGTVDGRADIYSLAVVLYEALCGRPPFAGDTEVARAMRRLSEDPVAPRRLVPGVPRRLSDCLMKALSRDPDLRPRSAAQFRAELADSLEATPTNLLRPRELQRWPDLPPVEPVRASGRSRPLRRSRSTGQWIGLVLMTSLIVAALALIAALLWDASSPGRPRSEAPTPTTPATPVRLDITSVSTHDPQGTGAPGENDDRVGLATDGDLTTRWPTEGYLARNLGGKDGVGLVIRLSEEASLKALVVRSPTVGWSAEVHLGEPGDDVPGGPPVAQMTDVSGDATVDLGGRRDQTVVLWITRLGQNGPPYRVEVADLTLTGTP
jgi:serine/threonine protein kinase